LFRITNIGGKSQTYDYDSNVFADADDHDITSFPWLAKANNFNPDFPRRRDFIEWITSNCWLTQNESESRRKALRKAVEETDKIIQELKSVLKTIHPSIHSFDQKD